MALRIENTDSTVQSSRHLSRFYEALEVAVDDDYGGEADLDSDSDSHASDSDSYLVQFSRIRAACAIVL